MLWLTGFLGLTRISFFLLTQISQIPRYCFVGGKSHRCFCAWAGSRGFHFAFGLTRISQIPQYRFVGGKSHRCFCVWAGSRGFHFAFGLTQISQIPQYCFVGGKSHRWFCVWAGSHGFRFAFGLTRISQIPRYCFVGGKSHRCFACGLARADSALLLGSYRSHRSHSIALWVGNLTDASACVDLCGLRWGHIALALTDLFFGPFRPFRPFGQIRPIGPISNRTDWAFLKKNNP